MMIPLNMATRLDLSVMTEEDIEMIEKFLFNYMDKMLGFDELNHTK